MTKKRRTLWIVGAVIVIGVAAFFGWHRGPKPQAVQIAKVGREDLQAKVTANGKVQAQKKVEISATIPGQVTHLAVKEGDRVRKGQFLLQLDPVSARAAALGSSSSMQALQRELDSARANRDQARADFARAEGNHKAGIIPAAEMERARTTLATSEASVRATEQRVAQARASVESAQDLLSKTTIRAPIDGTVTARRIEEGEVAVIGVQNQPGTVLLTISDMSVVEAEMEVDEASIPSVTEGLEARVRVDAYPNQTFSGLVTEVGHSPIVKVGALNEAIKFKVKVQIKNPPESIKPGLSVQADILTGFRSQALVVPIQALIVRDVERKPGEKSAPGAAREEEGVYLMEADKVRFQKVKTGLLGETSLELLEGLKGGETIITGPFRALRELKPGDAVREDKPGEKHSGPSGG
jgi:HlyD family secretion protein